MAFKPNKAFRKKYKRLWKQNPEAANLFLLMCELADERGQMVLPENPQEIEQELADLMNVRFDDPRGWAL